MNLHFRTLLSMRHIKNESMTLKPIYEPTIHATPTDMFELNGLNGHSEKMPILVSAGYD